MSKKFILIFLFIILLGAFLRFYKLDWGGGIFPHPDEYHIAASVNQLDFPTQMHPHFFSYGTFVIYLIYFTKEGFNLLGFEANPFLLGRFYSALFSTFSLPLIYLITRRLFSQPYALLSTFVTATTPGLVQQAHFATPESILIFFILFTTYLLLKQPSLSGVTLGFSLAVKVSSLVMILPIITTVFLSSRFNLKKIIVNLLIILTSTVLILFITAPFIFLDLTAFKANLDYEGGLAAGLFPVFYTRQFIDTLPVIFQLTKIYPYALGPSLEITGFVGFTALIFLSIKKRSLPALTVILTFLTLFIFNSLLLAKWTRFISPTFPFFSIFLVSLLIVLSKVINKYLLYIFVVSILFLHIVWSLAFFSIYLREDVRHSSSKWINANLPHQSTLLVEGGNMIDVPFGGNFKVISKDFYAFEDSSEVRDEIFASLESADYFIVQSRRVFTNHQRLPHLFPQTSKFYQLLFSGELGYKEINRMSSYPQISVGSGKIEINDENAEETWSVFDHPVIRIYQKVSPKSKSEYEQLF